MNEKKLAERLASGDTSALGDIISAYSGYVHTVAYNFSRGTLTEEDIEETAADVFYKLWCAREKLSPEPGLRPYLSAITRNTVSDRIRSKKLVEDIEALEIPSDLLVEDAAELSEMTSCLYDGLKQLSEEDQQIFFRFYFNGDKASQIAAALGTNKGAVDTRLWRIRKKLRDFLAERGFDHV